MRKIKEVLRLHYESGLQHRAIARSVGTSHELLSNLVFGSLIKQRPDWLSSPRYHL